MPLVIMALLLASFPVFSNVTVRVKENIKQVDAPASTQTEVKPAKKPVKK